MLRNLTPHPLRVRIDPSADPSPLDSDLILVPSGSVARCQATTAFVADADGIPVSATTFGAVEGLPTRQRGVTLVTSTLVAQAAKRADVVSPLTDGTAVRKDGQVYAVRGFQTFARTRRANGK